MTQIERFFLWCSDTDIHTLNFVNAQDRKSNRYQINYGRLVLIPTIMSAIGTMHAMSDFTNNSIIYVSIGLMVGWFVFVIDRAIIATYEKKEKGLGKQFWWRFLLSIVMGYIIALFFIFFFFQNRINKELNDELFYQNSNTTAYYDAQVDSIKGPLNEREEFLDFLNEVNNAELNGGGVKTFIYDGLTYTTSGRFGSGISLKRRNADIDELKQEIDTKKEEIKKRLVETEEKRAQKITRNNASAERLDPLIKLEMLVKIVKNHPYLLLIIIPLYMFLLALDILPIIVKELAQTTKYDNLFRNKELSKIELEFTKYQKETQRSFDQSYKGIIEPPDSILKEIIKSLKNVSNIVSEQNWYQLIALSVPIGIGLWYCETQLANKVEGINRYVIPILVAVLADLLSKFIMSVTKKKIPNNNNSKSL